MATIFEGFIIAITILSTNIADGNKIWGFIMVTQHIPTMTKSHHGGKMSVMIKVGICQWQNPTIHEQYYWEYICLKVPHITTGNKENLLLFFGGAQIFLVEKIYFGIHFQFLSLQSETNVLSVGNKNCKLKILNQEITVNAHPIRFQWERQRAEKNQTNATNVLMHHITPAN